RSHSSLLPSVHHLSLHSFPTRRSSDLVAIRQLDRFGDRLFGDLYSVMGLVPVTQTFDDSDRLLHAGLLHIDRLKTPLERTVFFRSEEHTSELQSPDHLVCRLLLEKKKQ